jgi:hypothetical protein
MLVCPLGCSTPGNVSLDLAWGYSASGNPVPRVERDLLAAVVIGSGKVRAARRKPAW